MSLSINNSNDIICDALFLLDGSNTLQNVLDLIAAGGGGGGGGSGITTLTGGGGAVVTGSATSKNITVDLSPYSTTTSINTLLNSYSTTSAINTIFSGYTDTAGMNTIFAGYTDTAGMNTIFADYTNTASLNTIFAGYTDTAGLNTRLSDYTNTAALNTLFAGYTDTAGLNTLLNSYSTTTSINTLFNNYSTTSTINTLLSYKQNTLTAGGNITISGNTISTVSDATEAWVTANFLSPLNPGTVGVTAGLSANMTANTFVISVDQNFDRRNLFILEDANLVLRHITTNTAGKLLYDSINLATEPYLTTVLTSYTTTAILQPDLDKINRLVDGVSVISMGNSSGITQRLAIYEEPNGQYFYGMGLVINLAVGLGFWGGSGANLPEQSTGSAKLPDMLITAAGRVGINQQNPVYTFDVTGDIRATGSIIGATKTFDIEHPDPDKKNTHRLRHWCVESDVIGGMVIYRKQITATKASTITIEMSDWFKHLVKNVIVFCSPYKHFGSAWGEYIGDNNIDVHTSKGGVYNILITCERNDPCATTMCPQEIEYMPVEPTNDNTDSMPH